jgi:hypothetical protein
MRPLSKQILKKHMQTFVLHSCNSGSFALREVDIDVLENRVLRKIFDTKGEEVDK